MIHLPNAAQTPAPAARAAILEVNLEQLPKGYRHARSDVISAAVRMMLREAIDSAVPFGNEQAREAARASVAQIDDLLDGFLPL